MTPSASAQPHRHRPGLPWGGKIERRYPGTRYGVVLALLLLTSGFATAGPTGDWVPLVAVVLQGATVLAALAASEASPRLLNISIVIIAFGLVFGVGHLFTTSLSLEGAAALLTVLLVAVVPLAIARGIWRHRIIDIQTMLGALCIYIALGLSYAFLYESIDLIGSAPFFAQHVDVSLAQYVYFSYVTLTTLGYGDLTAAGNVGRMFAVSEALMGQLYIVTVIGFVVTQLRFGGGDDTTDASGDT